MTLTYITNYLNHHTRFLAQALYARLGLDFCFIETQTRQTASGKACPPETLAAGEQVKAGRDFDDQAFRMGYSYAMAGNEKDDDLPWLHRAYLPEEEVFCRLRAEQSDAVLIANASDDWVLPRLKKHRLTFRAHERWYKQGLPWYRWPRAVCGGWLHHGRFRSLHMLCASAFTAQDAASVFCYRGKAYRWGYFPQLYTYRDVHARRDFNQPAQLLWAGRMIDWKRAEDALAACAVLRESGLPFFLRMIGTGPLETALKKTCQALRLENQVQFLGSQQPAQVRDWMERSDVFLLTSDYQEGWGVVLNEAMNSGCAVVASHAVGAAPYLLTSGVNGTIYPSKDVAALANAAAQYIRDPALRRQHGQQAYETILKQWSPEIAADRLLCLCCALLKQSPECVAEESAVVPLPETGPCSPAPCLKDQWMKARRTDA